MKPEAVRRAEALLRVERGSWTRVAGGGYSIAEHWIASWDGGSAFLELAVTEDLARRLRDGHRFYAALDAPFMPRLLGWDEDGRRPLLVLEDLTPGAGWPPPWRDEAIDAVRATLAEVAATPPPAGLPRLADDKLPGWEQVATNVDAFLGLGVCSRAWLEAALPVLAAAATGGLDGDELLHLDVRSDNLCVRDGRAILFDWNFASVGNAAFDTAFWLPSLALEGGPPPVGARDAAGRRAGRDGRPVLRRPRLAAAAGGRAARAAVPARPARGGAPVGRVLDLPPPA